MRKIYLESDKLKESNEERLNIVDPKSNFSLLSKWIHNFSKGEFPQTNHWFKLLQVLGQALGTASVHAHVWSEKREKSATNEESGEH